MAKETRKFVAGRMNKTIDERLLPKGEYVDAMNIRAGATELTEAGAAENTKGNSRLTTLAYNTADLSSQAVCIGTYADSENETMYWFVHDSNHSTAINGKVDMIVSFNTTAQQLTYHVVTELLLNFNPSYLINSIDKIDDLLFFTDNYNEPRKINVTRDYSFPDVTLPAADVDQIIELDVSVIKPPPIEAPVIELNSIAGGENYIEDTFICFAYRYQYADGEYSALSQFSLPAFTPKTTFTLESESYLNDAMENVFNEIKITYNTGSAQVKGVDVVFKEADSNNIFVIDEYNVESLTGQLETISFTNGEIYTVLRGDEILRLYDNVPLQAEAQTIFGNRLMYGNYVEQRDLTDSAGESIDLSYNVQKVSSETSASKQFGTSLTVNDSIEADSTLQVINPVADAPPNVTFGNVKFDMSNIIPATDLLEGSVFQFSITFEGTAFSNNGTYGDNTTTADSFNLSAPFDVVFTLRLDQDYTSLADIFAAGNPYFAAVWGWDNYEGSPLDWPNGNTWIDLFNAAVPSINNTGNGPITYNLAPCMATRRQAVQPAVYDVQPPLPTAGSGTLAQNDWGGISVSLAGTTLKFSPPAHRYRDDSQTYCTANYAPIFQYFRVNRAYGSVTSPTGLKSLHSNRDYQVGIVYQDSSARQTTVLVSQDNSAHIPSVNSVNLNHLKVTIPATMHPPSWATRYKLLLKPSQGLYETIFANRSYTDEHTGMVWVKLEGEQNNKVTEGLRLVVKSDSNGPLSNVVNATVLEVQSQPENFLEDSGVTTFEQPAGAYMRVLPVGWSADNSSSVSYDTGQMDSSTTSVTAGPSLNIDLFTNIGGTNTRKPVRASDVVKMRFHIKRNHFNEDGVPCGAESCLYENTIISTQDYPDFKSFWEGQGVDVSASDCVAEYQDDSGANENVYNSDLGVASIIGVDNHLIYPFWSGRNQYQFFYKTGDVGALYLSIRSGTTACADGEGRDSAIYGRIEILSSTGNFVFETVPQKVADGIYYEGADNYPISGGLHESGDHDDDQNQTASVPAVVNLSFFNCFAFGNGVESYKIRDSFTGNYFTLGNRSAGVTTQDYEQIRREASITYSGLYQEQTALNNLNNFNLGLANYKDCEESYGPIEIMHSFRDNLLVLQEDRISYIQIGKNLLSGGDGGDLVTSVPTILGQQIVRVEEYGISNNPESFATYGRDMFFTDAKRGAVIKLSGVLTAGDELQVISEIGMRTWFRDLFISSFTTQKLGGYDPYMNEYVLASNTNNLPLDIPTTHCRSRAAGAYLPPIDWAGMSANTSYNINAGEGIGSMDITFTYTHSVTITVTYNGVSNVYVQTGSGTLVATVSKNLASVSNVEVLIEPTDVNIASVTTMDPACPTGAEVQVIRVCLTDADDANQTIINQYSYYDNPYTSPLVTSNATFLSGSTTPIVSEFIETTGTQGTGGFPTSTADVKMGCNNGGGGTFVFNTNTDEFAYVATNGAGYANTPAGIAAMLAASTGVATDTALAPALYTGEFTLTGGWDKLYLIYDYRSAGGAVFCSTTSVDPLDNNEVCCECSAIIGCTPFLGSVVVVTSAAACAADPVTTTYYHTGSGITPNIGDTIYSDAGCGNGVILGAENYIMLGDGSNKYISVASNGQIINKLSC